MGYNMEITKLQSGFAQHVSHIERDNEIHAQYYSTMFEQFVDINILHKPERDMGTAQKAIEEYKKQYPSQIRFRIVLTDKSSMVIDVTYPKETTGTVCPHYHRDGHVAGYCPALTREDHIG